MHHNSGAQAPVISALLSIEGIAAHRTQSMNSATPMQLQLGLQVTSPKNFIKV
jgi:hypothetical protein